MRLCSPLPWTSLDAHVSKLICIPSASGHAPPPSSSNVCFPCQSPSAHRPPVPPLFLCLTLVLPYERAPSRASPCTLGAPASTLFVSPLAVPKSPAPQLSQSSLCQFPGEGHAWLLLPLLLPRLWPCALRPLGHNPLHSTHRRPSHLQLYSSTHPSPGSPGSPSPSQTWHRADRLWRPLLTPAHLSTFLLLEDLCELSHCLLYIHRLFCLFSAGMGGLNKNTLVTRW